MMLLLQITFVTAAFVIVEGKPKFFRDHDHLSADADSELSAANDMDAKLSEGQRTLRQAAPLPEITEGSDENRDAASSVGDCRRGFRRWPADGRCYPTLRQGPCPAGHVLSAAADGYEQPCRPNHCKEDGTLEWHGKEGVGCFPLRAPDSGCESEKMLYLDATSKTLVCNQHTKRAKRQDCPPGYRLDPNGTCRKVYDSLRQKSRE